MCEGGTPSEGVSNGSVGSWLTETSFNGGWKLVSIVCVCFQVILAVRKYSAMYVFR